MYEHEDELSGLTQKGPLNERLQSVHRFVRQSAPCIDRIAVALYDRKTDFLKTFIASSGGDQPLLQYECPMSEAPSLREILLKKRPRLANDLSIFSQGAHEHTRRIEEQGYGSSYTVPIFSADTFWGFIFFNSYSKDCFKSRMLRELDLVAHLISGIVIQELSSVRILLAALKSASDMVHQRDPETGSHLDRMSRFARVIAQHLAQNGKYNFNDEYIERIFIFSPLHDVGKIGIPDEVLRKPAKLNADEFEVMKAHTVIGMNIIDELIQNFGFQSFDGVDVLRNIAGFHHEKVNGAGYPMGLKGDLIPPEARIVAVADIFDALTSRRPYKRAWANNEALKMLAELANSELDRDCVEALVVNRNKIEEIQSRFQEEAQAN